MPLIDTQFRATEPRALPDASGIALCVPYLGGREAEYLAECIATNYVSSVGPFVPRFERAIADYVGTEFAVATVNGTAALHLALLAVGVRPDDEVLVSTLSFIAPANAVRYCGAWPVFIDAEIEHWQMSPAAVAEFLENRCVVRNGLTVNSATGRIVRAIVPVHILGHPVEMGPIVELAHRYGLAVVEDATESLGARYHGRHVGTLGDIACLSFNGNKLITTGGGGMVITSQRELAERCAYLSTQAKDDPIEYIHGAVGFNYRLTNIPAALGCAQMERIAEHIAAKRRIAERYASHLQSIPGLTIQAEASWAESIWWMTTIRIDHERYGATSREVMLAFRQRGIATRPLWQPLHLSPAHATAAESNAWPRPIAERLVAEALSLPSSVGLTDREQETVVGALIDIHESPSAS